MLLKRLLSDWSVSWITVLLTTKIYSAFLSMLLSTIFPHLPQVLCARPERGSLVASM